MDKPNVLWMVADQHNAKILGHKGHPDVKTPHLDRMAAEGVRFENAVCPNPICTPSRVSFLSGQYCHNHGYYGLSGPHPGGLPNVFGYFRQHGYRTAAIGKIHCPEYWIEDACDVFHDTSLTSVGGRSESYADFLRSRGKEDLEDHLGLREFGNKGIQSVEGRPSKLTYEESAEGWIAQKTRAFMQACIEDQQPFLAFASFPRPHQSTSPAQEFWDLYDHDSLTLPPNTDYDMRLKAPHFRKTVERWRKGDWTLFEPETFEAGRRRKLHGYLGAVSQVDHAVGELLDFVRGLDLPQNTIVVYMADHGDYACEHDIMEKAPGICSDAITRVPLIWWSNAHFEAGHVAHELVELTDIVPTLCSLAGLEPLETCDGKDLSHVLHGKAGAVHTVAVTEFAWSKSIRKGHYRFVYYPPEMFKEEYPDGFGELYNLQDDPWEMKNLYFEPQHQGLVQEFRADLLHWLITTTRPKTVHGVNSGVMPEGRQFITRNRAAVNADGKISPRLLPDASYDKNYL